jgi:hypothetical protein
MSQFNITIRTDPLNPRSLKVKLSREALAGVCFMAEAIYGDQAPIQIHDAALRQVSCPPMRQEYVLAEGEEVFDYTPNEDWQEFVQRVSSGTPKKITARITGRYQNYLVTFNTPDFIRGMEQACSWLEPECEGVEGYLRDVHGM